MRRISHDTYQLIFGVAYLGLMTNAMLVVACLPLLALLTLTDPAQTWPLIAVLAPLAAPALSAAFTVFRRYSDEGSVEVVRGFWRAWRATARRALALGVATSGALVVLVVNLQVRAATELSALAVPPLTVLTVLVAATCLNGLVALAEVPEASLREIALVSAVLGLRRWYLTAVSLIAWAAWPASSSSSRRSRSVSPSRRCSTPCGPTAATPSNPPSWTTPRRPPSSWTESRNP